MFGLYLTYSTSLIFNWAMIFAHHFSITALRPAASWGFQLHGLWVTSRHQVPRFFHLCRASGTQGLPAEPRDNAGRREMKTYGSSIQSGNILTIIEHPKLLTYIHALHCITLHCIALHYITLHTYMHPCMHASIHPYIHPSIHTQLHHITSRHVTSHCITLHSIT